MRIGELARSAGLKTSAVRYYESRGLLPKAGRRAGQRVFDDSAATQLAVVRLAKDAGFTLAEIRELVTDFPVHRWRRLAKRKLGEIRSARERLAAMERLLTRLVGCRCFDLEVCGRAVRSTLARGRT